jgi:hypothetical protein
MSTMCSWLSVENQRPSITESFKRNRDQMNPCKDLDVPVYHDTELFICSKNLAHELNTQHCTKRCVNSSLFYCNVSSARYRISFFFRRSPVRYQVSPRGICRGRFSPNVSVFHAVLIDIFAIYILLSLTGAT